MALAAKSAAAAAKYDPDSELVSRLLKGAVDLHCHSGPSVMPRTLNHIEAMQDAAKNGLRAVLIKDHYYSATPITEMLNEHFKDLKVTMLSGVPLNNTSGGFNPYTVDHGVKLGAKLVWMPTFSSANHIAEDEKSGRKFPHTRMPMLPSTPLTVLDARGAIKDEVKVILDMIAEHGVVLSGGHLNIKEIFPLFEEAKRRGIERLLVNHPTYLIGASHADIRQLAGMGAYLEHSLCMFIPESKFKFYEPAELKKLIEAGTVERTILGSDLGQVGNCWPARGFRHVICICLELGFSEADVVRMISRNPAELIGLDR